MLANLLSQEMKVKLVKGSEYALVVLLILFAVGAARIGLRDLSKTLECLEALLVMVLAVEGLFAMAHLRQDRYAEMEGHRQQFLIEWIRLISEHNWRLLEHKASTGHSGSTGPVSAVDVVAFQHLNLLLFFWTHQKELSSVGLEAGLKRWVSLLIEGAKSNPEFKTKYNAILKNGDIYPDGFLDWAKNLGLEADKF